MSHRKMECQKFPAMLNPTHRLIADFNKVALRFPQDRRAILDFIDANLSHPKLEDAIDKSESLAKWVDIYIDHTEDVENGVSNRFAQH